MPNISQSIQHKSLSFVRWLLAPSQLASITTKLPFIICQKSIELACNKMLEEPVNEGEFDFLNAKVLQIEIIDARLFAGLSFRNNKIICVYMDNNKHSSDVTLSIATADAISLMEQKIDPDTLFFHRKLKIQGNTELAHHVKNTIDNLDPDLLPAFLKKIVMIYRDKILT
ncbi:MAG: SCP2 sterol-binding domain-containing protein [Gammaproteobacteria bacterium]|nr:SCP2 sterol-binding domain-containing protein [Gammaproteobacteria bacterium]